MTYLKPQSPIQLKDNYVYPLTTDDQVIREKGGRLNQELDEMLTNLTDMTERLSSSEELIATIKSLAKANPPYNYLDNSDFTNPVNQRNITSGANTALSYCIDRWKYCNLSFSTSSSGVGLSLNSSSTVVEDRIFEQCLEDKVSVSLIGEKLTFAVCDSSNNIEAITGTVVSPTSWGMIKSNDFSKVRILMVWDNDATHIIARIVPLANITIKYAVIYKGEYTKETLPDYRPKGYSTELMECQRYY